VAWLTGQDELTGAIASERHRLRMLAVLASPVAGAAGGPPEGPPLDFWGEWERLAEALGAQDAADGGAAPWAVGRLPSPTAAALADELAQSDGYQVLHLACHGCPDGVVLEDRLGREALVPTAALVSALRGRSVRLAVLNACETLEVARALVDQGAVDTVIATRESIYDDEAKALTRRLYRRLAQGEPAASALGAARDEIGRLAEERPTLGRDPAARAANLVLVGDGDLRLTVEPPVAETPRLRRGLPPHNEPIPLGALARFVGRHEELYELMSWFEKPGRVAFALHGVGGIGKTTLALAAAVRQSHRFEALAFATAKDRADFGPREVHHALAGALRLQPDPAAADDPEAAVTRLLNARRVLLVLDNLETVSARTRAALGRILDGIEPAAGSRVLLTLRPREADPLTRRLHDHRRLDSLDEASALLLAWELKAARNDLSEPPAPGTAGGSERRLENLAVRAHLRGLPLAWLAALDRLAELAFRHPKMIELAIALVAEHGWQPAEARLRRLAGQDVKQALDELIGTMVDNLRTRDPEAFELLHAVLVFEGGAPLTLLREVALGRRVEDEDDEAFAFADGPLRAARRSNLLTGDRRFDLDPPVRAYLEHYRPPSPERRRELELRHARALVPVIAEFDRSLVGGGRYSFAAVPEWSNLAVSWDRLAHLSATDTAARDALVEHCAEWRNLLVNTYDARRESWLEAALAATRAKGDRLGEANTLRAIGDVLQFRKQLDEALDHYHRALDAFRAVGDRLGEANTLRAIGDVLQFRSQLDDALDHYHRALDAFRAVGDRLGEANTLRAIGAVLQFRSQLDDALDHYHRALDAFRAVGSRLGEAHCRAAEGQVALLRGDPAAAEDRLGEAVQIYREISDHYDVPAQIGNFGWALVRAGRKDEARPYLLRAAELFDAMGLADYAERHRLAAAAG
jgi:tetratricopeptide (TPR) repeat protein